MSALTVAETLRAAADLIEPEGAWTQGSYWKGADGDCYNNGYPDGALPLCWCALGALGEVGKVDPADLNFCGRSVTDKAYKALIYTIGEANVVWWNDSRNRTQAEVVAALRAAAVVSEGL